MVKSDGTGRPPGEGDSGSGADVSPSVRQAAGGVHYHFPVDITVVQKQSEVDEAYYHFPVEIAVVGAERSMDVSAVAELVLDRLAQQLESEKTSRS